MDYQKYRDLVKQEIKPYVEVYSVTESELDDFISREERIIKERFGMCLEAIEKGEMTIEQMKYGSVGSTAYCLAMLFE